MSASVQKPVFGGHGITTASAEPAPNEVTRTKRAIGIDVARAVALVGMVAVHVYPETNDNDETTWAFAVFAGRAAALFALLAGVSIAFVEKRSRGQLSGRTLAADRAALAIRGLLILLAGLLLGHLDSPLQTIIPYFGVLFLLAIPIYGRSTRFFLVAAPLFAIFGPVLAYFVRPLLPEQPTPEADYTLVTMIQHPLAFLSDMLLIGFYPALLWMAYLCAGIVIGRQVLTSRRVALVIAGWGAGLALGAWLLSKLLLGPAGGMQRLVESTPGMTPAEITETLTYGPDISLPNTTWWWLAAVSPYSETPLNVLHNLGAAMALVGVVLLLSRSGSKVFSPFAAFGAMTLTLYSAHCVLLTIEVLDEGRPMVSLWIQIISFMLFALMWRNSMGKGPLESIISEASDWIRTLIQSPQETPDRWRRKRPETATVPPAAPPSETDLPAKVPRPSRTQ